MLHNDWYAHVFHSNSYLSSLHSVVPQSSTIFFLGMQIKAGIIGVAARERDCLFSRLLQAWLSARLGSLLFIL